MSYARPNTTESPIDAEARRTTTSYAERVREERPQSLRFWKPLIMLAAAALVCACLALAREVLLPVAFASLLALVLTPLVDLAERRRVHRIVAVLLVVVCVFTILGGVVWILAQQVSALANDLPRYRHNIRQKVADVRVFG